MAEMGTQIQESASPLGLQRMAAEHELMRATTVGMGRIEEHPDWKILSQLPIRLTSGVPIPRFRLRDLLGLRAGQILETVWVTSDDVPLKVGAVQVGWSEFEVVEQRMAIRLTRLA